jgi:hypothetical protein
VTPAAAPPTTGETTGPFALIPGATVQLDDPFARLGAQSSFVQLQNASGLAISVLSGGNLYTITSNQSSTIPTPGSGQELIASAGDVGLGGTLTAVWLLKGQSPPQPDGPLTAQDQLTIRLDALVGDAAAGTPFTADEQLPLFATTMRLVAPPGAVTSGDGFEITVTGDATSTVYFDQVFPAGAVVFDVTFPVDTSSDLSVTITISVTVGIVTFDAITVYAAGPGIAVVSYAPTTPTGINELERAGGSGVGTTTGAVPSSQRWLTSVTIAWALKSVAITPNTDTFEIIAGDVAIGDLLIVLLGDGDAGHDVVTVQFPDDGIPTSQAPYLQFASTGAILVSGLVSAQFRYRD